MASSEEKIAAKLKEIIDINGPSYVTGEPYLVYKKLLDSKSADRKTAGAVMHALVSGATDAAINNADIQELSGTIQEECCLNKAMADRVAQIFSLLYSSDSKNSWKKKNKEGLRQFLSEKFSLTWKGFAVWDEGNGTVDCHYEAKIVLMPLKDVGKDKELARLLKQNPFMTKKEIHMCFEKRLRKYLDYEFNEYCTDDDYYQPVVEDFEIDYRVSGWSRENGFEVVSCDGDGDDAGYEPKYRR